MLFNSCFKRIEAPLARNWRATLRDCLRNCLLPCLLPCLLTAVLSCLTSSVCSAANWRDELPQAMQLGEGEMRWLGFRIYQATLWAGQRPFQPERPFALQLHYYRTISRERLVQTSLSEIRRISRTAIDAATLAQWEIALNRAFTDVVAGDQLIGVYVPGHGMRFHNQQRLLADIDDVGLARAFFAIWLDERTRDHNLRRTLLGEQQ